MALTPDQTTRLIAHMDHIAAYAAREGDDLLQARAETLRQKLGGAPRERDIFDSFWGQMARNNGGQFP